MGKRISCGLALLCAVLVSAPATAQDGGDGGSGDWVEEASESADAQEVADGGAASDPTASVNYEDFRFRYLDLGGDRDRSWYTIEGAASGR